MTRLREDHQGTLWLRSDAGDIACVGPGDEVPAWAKLPARLVAPEEPKEEESTSERKPKPRPAG